MKKSDLLHLIVCVILLLVLSMFPLPKRTDILAEQSGSSPESGTDSYIKTLYDSLVLLGYGSTAAGTWGDWGAYWNKIRSAAEKPFNDAVANGLWNGTGHGSADCVTTFDLNCYTKAKGGVDDYNEGESIPDDTYQQTWTTCNDANSYCSTDSVVAEKQDPNTGLVWSPRIYDGTGAYHWFWANNCKYPNGLTGDDGTCGTHDEVACYCVKHTGEGGDTKTGCEAYDDEGWRLPTQKELMQVYIDGSWSNLTNPGADYWSATTSSNATRYAWFVNLGYGYAVSTTKAITGRSVRCVR